MIKQVNVTFDFDMETETVSNIKCSVDGTEGKKKTTTTKKVKDIVEDTSTESLISLEASKLTFNGKAIAEMAIEYEDRIVIKWIKEGKGMIPVIGKDLAFGEEGTGNKVTKSNSIAYKGKSNTVLAEKGSEFKILPYKEGIFKLISTAENTESIELDAVIEIGEATEPELIVESDEITPIEELGFVL